MKRLVAVAALLAIMPAWASAQSPAQSSAQSPAQSNDHPSGGQGYFFFGLGDAPNWRRIVHVGGGGEGFLYKGLGVGAEVGYARWKRYDGDAWIVSGDFSYHFRRSAPRGGVDPFVLGGITGFFPTSTGRGAPAGNFGGGVNVWLTEHAALRLEVRDHVNTVGTDYPGPHYVSFRFGVTFR